MTEALKERMELLKFNYYSYMAEIIKGRLCSGGDMELEEWGKTSLPFWDRLLIEAKEELEQYRAYLSTKIQPADVAALFALDVKKEIREYLSGDYKQVQRKLKTLELEIEAKREAGILADKDVAKALLQKSLNFKETLYNLKRYLDNYDDYFTEDSELIKKYMLV